MLGSWRWGPDSQAVARGTGCLECLLTVSGGRTRAGRPGEEVARADASGPCSAGPGSLGFAEGAAPASGLRPSKRWVRPAAGPDARSPENRQQVALADVGQGGGGT